MGARGILAIVVGAAALVLTSPASAVVDATFAAGTGVLTVTGDGDDDDVSVSCDGEVVVDDATVPDEPIPCAAVTSVVVDSGAGRDTITLSGLDAAAFTAVAQVSVDAGGDDDFITGSPGADGIDGGGGDDTLIVNGTDDEDEFEVSATTLRNLQSDRDDSIAGLECFEFYLGLGSNKVDASAGPGRYTVYGDSDADELVGGELDDLLDGGDGTNVLVGNAGADALNGGTGVDSIDGGEGNDTLVPGSETNMLLGGAGLDTLILAGSSEADLLTIGASTLELDGSLSTFQTLDLIRFSADDGNDEIAAADASVALEISGGAGDDAISGGSGSDRLYGEGGDDDVSGGPGADTIEGDFSEAGDDRLDGGPGADAVQGGGGADSFELSAGDDVVDGNGGSDRYTVTFGVLSAAVADSGAGGHDELAVTNYCSTLTFTANKVTRGSDSVTYSGIDAAVSCATDPPPPPPPPAPPPPPQPPPPPPPVSPPPSPPPVSPPPPAAAPPPPAPPRAPAVKKSVKITVCHKRKTKKVTRAQLKKLKGAKRGKCKPKPKPKKKR